MEIFKNAKWIWNKKAEKKDSYVEFDAKFNLKNKKDVFIKISADSVYELKINGKTVNFTGCADYPHYKLVDKLDISKFVKKGENEINVLVWYFGEDSQTYVLGNAGLIFEIEQNGNVIISSDKNINSRIREDFKNGYKKVITSQLGFSFLYDFNVNLVDFTKSNEIKNDVKLFYREIKPLTLLKRVKTKTVKKGNSVILDLGKETAGYFDMDIESKTSQKLTFAYSERLVEGKCPRLIGGRDFSFEVVLKEGRNKLVNLLRRFAGRYIEIFFEEDIKINYCGLREVVYPITVKKAKLKDKLEQKIYDVCVDTLRLCMHEHYEDCPWREQALYVLDSRNQMLCGYYAFNGYDYQRANLKLISNGLRKDGMLSLSFPAGLDFPIPFFSLSYIMQVYEYLKYSGDKSVLEFVLPLVKTIMKSFTDRVDELGLIPSLPYPFWNFYEWADYSNNEDNITRKKEDPYNFHYDLIINCMFVYVSKFYNEITGENINADKTKNAIKEKFFDKDNGVFTLTDQIKNYSQLGNAMAILAGVGDEKLADKIINDKNMISATLSMRAFLYDSLLTFGDKYKDFIEKDIVDRYSKMLDAGATSFWETEIGGDDFGGAGSLCHGWSAIPVYYLSVLDKIKY